MTYHEYQEQTEVYNSRIEARISDWARIAQNEMRMWDKNKDTQSYKANPGARRFLSENITEGPIDYTYPISMEFDIHYSGCSNENGYIELPEEILWEDENDWVKYLTMLEDVIKHDNVKIEVLIEGNKAKEKVQNEINLSEQERAEYIRLKNKYEDK